MPYPVDTYTFPSGGGYAGMSALSAPVGLPSWVPPKGYFADVPMTNTARSVNPSIYSGEPDSPNLAFNTWGGSAILQDYSPLGAQVYRSGGHESTNGQVNVQMTLLCDFSTLMWSAVNVPLATHPNTDFGSTGWAADGTAYNSHTYDGLQEFPAAWGGGPKGSMIQFFFAGGFGANGNVAIVTDPTQAHNGYSQLGGLMPMSANGSGSSYPTTTIDRKRQGWWIGAWSLSVDYMLFVSKDGTVTHYPALHGNMSDGCYVLCDSLDIIVAINGGYLGGPNGGSSANHLSIRDNATGSITTVAADGPVPTLTPGYGDLNPPWYYHMPDKCGLQWVNELGCIVGIDPDVSPPNIVKLTPGANPKTDAWTWSVVPVQHWDAGDPSGATTLSAGTNGIWSKFRWVPALHGFVYCTSDTSKPQIVRI